MLINTANNKPIIIEVIWILVFEMNRIWVQKSFESYIWFSDSILIIISLNNLKLNPSPKTGEKLLIALKWLKLALQQTAVKPLPLVHLKNEFVLHLIDQLHQKSYFVLLFKTI
jgi:hypothetical protein